MFFIGILIHFLTSPLMLIPASLIIFLIFQHKKQVKAQQIYLEQLRQSSIYEIDQMNGLQFEHYLSTLYQSFGYHTEVTKGSGDFGADLILRNNNEKIVVQAKRYKNKVGLQSVQEVVGAKRYYDAAHAWVVTNNYFTEPARKLAHANDVLLIDRDLLIKLSAQINQEKATTRTERYNSN
ncbi:restriction endonuclease [Bacillus cereus]|uniref:restriction endonuclease n=1 Tax=Bacillus cereus TaxID=1396 RepID=UPI001E2EDD85|nr:restriction endonuclease [Bacillus cereus]MCD2332909.1 restriction endonuclease [Bacillus cereus]